MSKAIYALLALSLAANLWLVTRGHAAAADHKNNPPAAGVAGDTAESSAAPKAAVPAVLELRACRMQLDSSRIEMKKLEADKEKRQSYDERYRAGRENPPVQAKISAHIQRLFGSTGASVNVDCRGDVCKLDFVRKEGQADNFPELLQQDRELKKSGVIGYEFESGNPGNDAQGNPVSLDKVLLKVSTAPPGAQGRTVLDGYYQRLIESGGYDRCYQQHSSDAGVLEVKMEIDENGEVALNAGGVLGGKEGGRCLVAALQDIIRSGRTTGPLEPAMGLYYPQFPPK